MMDQDLGDLIRGVPGLRISTPARCDELMKRLRQADERFRRNFVDEIKMLGMLKAVQSSEPRWIALHEDLGGMKRRPGRREPGRSWIR